MSRASFIMRLLEESVIFDQAVEASMTEGDDDSEITNKRRAGTWMTPDHVKHAAANPKRTQAFYDRARKATDAKEQEKWLARVFNTEQVAQHIADSYYQKEADSWTLSVDDLDSLSQSLVQGIQTRSNAGQVVSAASNKRDDLADLRGKDAERGSKATTASFMVLSIKDLKRDPEEIVHANRMVDLLYRAIEKEWPKRRQNMMVFTYLLMRWNVSHLIKRELPYYKELCDIIDKCEKDNRSWMTANWFQYYSGIEQKMYDKVVKHIMKTASELSGD